MEIAFSILAFVMMILVLLAIVIRRRWRVIGILFVLLAVIQAGIWIATPQFSRRLSTALNTNIAETSPAPEFQELRTRTYSAKPGSVYAAVTETIASRPDKWAVVDANPTAGSIHATVKVLNFIDDVNVRLQMEGDSTRVDVHSNSRVGKGDFGENRRHIAWLLEGLDRRLH